MPSYQINLQIGVPSELSEDDQQKIRDLLSPTIGDILGPLEPGHIIVGPVVPDLVLGSHGGGGAAAQLNLFGNLPAEIVAWHESPNPPTLVEMALQAPGVGGSVWDGLTSAQQKILERISADPEQSAAIMEATHVQLREKATEEERAQMAKKFSQFSELKPEGVDGLVKDLPIRCMIRDENYEGDVQVLIDADTKAVMIVPAS